MSKIKEILDLPITIKGFSHKVAFVALALAIISAFYPYMLLALLSFVLALYARYLISQEKEKIFKTANIALIISGISIVYYILTLVGVLNF